MTDPIKAKIIEAVPEIRRWCECRNETNSHEVLPRPITLADVLRAVMASKSWGKILGVDDMDEKQVEKILAGRAGILGELIVRKWNLAVNWDDQTQEVKDFIGKLLGV